MPGAVPLVYLIAGENSGDRLGAGLMETLTQNTGGRIRLAGIGGERMQRAGLSSLFPMRELSLMGFWEIVPHLPRLLQRINQTTADILAARPDLVVTIDSPGFAFRLARLLRARGYKGKLMHYVAPSVWAYRPGRAKRTARLFDHLLTLLPFEPPYFEKEGLRCTFVGHPVVYELRDTASRRGVETRRQFTQAHGISESATLLCVLPGSRIGELKRHLSIFKETVRLVAERFPRVIAVMPVPADLAAAVEADTAAWAVRCIVVSDEEAKRQAMLACDVGLVKSGTVALEAALTALPMVVAYRVHPISAWVMRWLSRTPYYNLVNIAAQREIIPEYIQEDCTPVHLAEGLTRLLSDPLVARRQTLDAEPALRALDSSHGSPSERAAHAVLREIGYSA